MNLCAGAAFWATNFVYLDDGEHNANAAPHPALNALSWERIQKMSIYWGPALPCFEREQQ